METAQQRALAVELGVLKANAEAAERAIDDACSDISSELGAHLPSSIKEHLTTLASMEPASDYVNALRDRFVTPPPFCDVLVGIASSVEEHIATRAKLLPKFQYPRFEPQAKPEPASATELRRLIHDVRKIVALADWWTNHREAFVSDWSTVLGEATEAGSWPPGSLQATITKLEEASVKAEPLDNIASHLTDAKDIATEWNSIQSEQEMREAIAVALEPLKELKHLVDAETHRTIESLSDRVGLILKDIRVRERFDYGNTEMERRQVTVHGRFSQGYKIDAALVANTSWLRAVLWAFTFAMRDEAIQDTGGCNFPLVVLDDPQVTFDPKNKRKWAQKIVEMANSDILATKDFQLLLATHERQFFDIVTGTWGLVGQRGMIARPHGNVGVVQILNGSRLERCFIAAKAEMCDERACEYVRGVRVYCEDLLRIMLRPESYELTMNTLGALRGLLEKYRRDRVAPFDRPIFAKLTEALKETVHQPVAYMNATSHTSDGTVGLAQAEDVERYWTQTLEKRFSDAFMLAADFDAYGSDRRLYAYPQTVIEFPAPQCKAIEHATLFRTGIAAAAASEGHVGDGTISIEEWDSADRVNLYNHSAYHVLGSSLEPVATTGDVLLVKNYGEPNDRNLVVAAVGNSFVARRLSLSDDHPGIAVLTGQSTNPYMLPQPIITPVDKLPMRKVVGTLFMSDRSPPPPGSGEVLPIVDAAAVASALQGARLFRVSGRSMEPIALENQLVITRKESIDDTALQRLEGTLVIAIDENGATYFKRLRRQHELIILESVNSDAWTPSELLSLNGNERPALGGLLAVVGMLFEEP